MLKKAAPLIMLVLFAISGCSNGSSDPSTGSETHWLSCNVDDDCTGNQRCINNRCTSDDEGHHDTGEDDTGEDDTGDDPNRWRLTIDEAHRSCSDDSECARITRIECSSCECDAVHNDYTENYTRDNLDCSDYTGGICDPYCGWFPADIPLCESGLCQLHQIDWNAESWAYVALNAAHEIAFPIGYAGPGLVEDGDHTTFTMHRRDGGELWHFETGPDVAEPAEFDDLPATFQYTQRRNLELSGSLVGAYYYDDHAGGLQDARKGRAVVIVGLAEGPFREILQIEYKGAGDERIWSILETITR
ncbi:MAG: hypothetical protein ACNA8W_10235 [Bradymonadaceae bacterium]